VRQDLQSITSEIVNSDRREIAEDIDASTSSDHEMASCPALGQIKFTFDSRLKAAGIEEQCLRRLWDVHSCTMDSELDAFRQHEKFISLMNSVSGKVTASLQKVDVKQSWLDMEIPRKTQHFTMVFVMRDRYRKSDLMKSCQ